MSAEQKTVMAAESRPMQRRGRVGRALAWCALLMGLVLSGWGLWGGHHRQTPAMTVEHQAASSASAEPQVAVFAKVKQAEEATHSVRRIETIRVGQRVLGRNPLREQVEHVLQPEPSTWRLVRLEMRKSNGRQLYVELLRPLSWLEQRQARVGDRLRLDLPEMGAQGWATVAAIAPCPAIEPGVGQVVTGRFRHEPDDNILDVRVAGQDEPIGVTATHPFWSEDRRAFVPVGQLHVGERVRTSSLGVVAITSIRHRPCESWVYNLEVQGEHVYQVSDVGVLVHNNNGTPPPNLSPPRSGRTGAFKAAKRNNGVPVGQQPSRVLPNVDRRENPQPGRIYEFEIPASGGGRRTVRIRDDAGGHFYGLGNPQNRGPHFNDDFGNHYDY